MLAYTAAVFQNCGNYKSFGDTKFVPECDPDTFKTILRASEGYALHKDTIESLLGRIEREMFTEEEPFSRIGFRDENNGTTSYYSSNVTKEDASKIDTWCQELGISPLNTRLFKLSDTEYELRVTSQFEDSCVTPYLKTYEQNGLKLHVKAADFADVMASVVGHMKKAL
jgi:dipeptidyl-peptidase-3